MDGAIGEEISQTEVTYTYKIVNLAGWAERPDVQKRISRYRGDSKRGIEDKSGCWVAIDKPRMGGPRTVSA